MNEYETKIREVLSGDWKDIGLEIFCYLKDGAGAQMKKFKVNNDLNLAVLEMIVSLASEIYLREDAVYDSAVNASDKKDCVYTIEKSEDYNPFPIVLDSSIENYFSDQDKDQLAGYLFCLNRNKSEIWCYQHVYATTLCKRKSGILVAADKTLQYKKVNEVLFIVEERIDAIIIDGTICTTKLNVFESNFGFESYVRSKAQNTIKTIDSSELVSGIKYISSFAAKDKLTNAKKLMKINVESPVFQMQRDKLFQNIKVHPRYKVIKIEDNHIKLEGEGDVPILLKLLNDDYLKSELSDLEYESPVKIKLKQE